MVLLFFNYKYLEAIVTSQKIPPGAQLPGLPDEMSKAKPLLSSSQQHKEALLDWVHLHADTSN